MSFASSQGWNGLPSCSLSLVSPKGPFLPAVLGASHTYTDGGWEGMLHRVILEGVAWGKPFWYKCDGAKKSVFDALAPPQPGHLPVTVRRRPLGRRRLARLPT